MEVILLERVEKLGQMGDLVKVKPGFARNYLLPQGKALRATKANLAQYEEQRSQLDAVNLERRGDAEKAASKIKGFICILLRQASDSDQLYGSVTARDIADAASESGVTIARNQIMLERPIKTLGVHAVKIVLHPEVIVSIGVNVARTTEEADSQKLAHQQPAKSSEAASVDHAEEEEAPTVEDIFENPEDMVLDDNAEEEETAAAEAAADDDSAEAEESSEADDSSEKS